MNCPECGRKMYPESLYIRVCPYCGHKVDLRKEKKLQNST